MEWHEPSQDATVSVWKGGVRLSQEIEQGGQQGEEWADMKARKGSLICILNMRKKSKKLAKGI